MDNREAAGQERCDPEYANVQIEYSNSLTVVNADPIWIDSSYYGS